MKTNHYGCVKVTAFSIFFASASGKRDVFFFFLIFQIILKDKFIIPRSLPALIPWQCVGCCLCGLAWSKPHCATLHIRSNNLLLCQYFALYAEWWERGLGALARPGDGGMYFTDLNRVWESGEPQIWGQLQPILTLLSSATLDRLARSQQDTCAIAGHSPI